VNKVLKLMVMNIVFVVYSFSRRKTHLCCSVDSEHCQYA